MIHMNQANESRSKDNQAVKFGQLVKYNIRNTFIQKPYRKWASGTNSRPLFVF